MLRLIRFLLLSTLKIIATVFYHFQLHWLSARDKKQWQQVSMIIFLNHTSLFEILFMRIAPFSFLWRLADQLIVPGADITFARPIVGKILHTLIPGIIPISRKKDDTWQHFLSLVDNEKVTAILPEGRMKRRNGLDKLGQPMSVRSGFVDILAKLTEGKILFIYSGGLHHIQAPGEKLPKLFKNIKANLEIVDLQAYKQQFSSNNDTALRSKMTADVDNRLQNNLPN